MPHVSVQLAELLGDSLGIAAVLLVFGWVLLRWQQDRQGFALLQTALEKGITQFPNAPPFWLVSLRQGLTMLPPPPPPVWRRRWWWLERGCSSSASRFRRRQARCWLGIMGPPWAVRRSMRVLLTKVRRRVSDRRGREIRARRVDSDKGRIDYRRAIAVRKVIRSVVRPRIQS